MEIALDLVGQEAHRKQMKSGLGGVSVYSLWHCRVCFPWSSRTHTEATLTGTEIATTIFGWVNPLPTGTVYHQI